MDLRDVITDHFHASTIVDTIAIPLLLVDTHLRVLTANRAFHETFATAPSDVTGIELRRVCDAACPTCTEVLVPAVEQAFDSGRDFDIERTIDGVPERTLLVRGRRGRHASYPTVLLTFEDISTLRRLERALHAAMNVLERGPDSGGSVR